MIVTSNTLCKPSQYYFILSFAGLILSITLNVYTGLNCNLQNNSIIFISQFFYICFWSWFLNKICQLGYKNISWALFLSPVIISFVLLMVYYFQQ